MEPDLVDAAKLRDADILRLADRLATIKTDAYKRTLVGLLRHHGEDRKRVTLSQPIRQAITEESELHARFAVQTLNRMIERWAKRNSFLPREQFAQGLNAFIRERGATRGRVVGEMAPLTARLDAEVAFYRENGVEPEFEFAGPPAVCDLCKVLKATGPHSIDKVMEVGYPHLNCTHHWVATTRATEALRAGGIKPGQITAGLGPPSGILGSRAMVDRLGGSDAALSSLTGEVVG